MKKLFRVTESRYHVTAEYKYIIIALVDNSIKPQNVAVTLDGKTINFTVKTSAEMIIDADTVRINQDMEQQWLIEIELPIDYEKGRRLKVNYLDERQLHTCYQISIKDIKNKKSHRFHQLAKCEFVEDECILHGECVLPQPITVSVYSEDGKMLSSKVSWLPRAEVRCFYPEYGYMMFSDYQVRFQSKDMEWVTLSVETKDVILKEKVSLKQKKREWKYRQVADNGKIDKIKYYGYRLIHECGKYTFVEWKKKIQRRLKDVRKSFQSEEEKYVQWFRAQQISSEQLRYQSKHIFDYEPQVWMATEKLIESQSYSHCNLEIEKSDYLVLMADGAVWEPDAIYECIKLLNQNLLIDVIYTDDDQMSDEGRYYNPNFKPDYNPDLLRSMNYIGDCCIVRRNMFDSVMSDLKPNYTMQEFYLACADRQAIFGHVSKVLCHIPDMLKQKQEITHITYNWQEKPLVSILIPNKDHIEELDKCIQSIEQKSAYKNYEILVIENNSTEQRTFNYYEKLIQNQDRIRVLYYDGEFNYSKINNYGVKQAKGEYILLLNNDTELISSETIWELLSHAMRPEVGIVGARLYFPDDTIQHAGVIVGYGGVAGHAFLGLSRDNPGYQKRIWCIQDYSAVTAACMMIPRTVYEEVGGLSEEYRVAFNDIDFCLRVREAGYLVVYNPYAELYHYESKSRGCENTKEKMLRYQQEVQLFTRRWREILLKGDPYYNVNLSLDQKDFLERR